MRRRDVGRPDSPKEGCLISYMAEIHVMCGLATKILTYQIRQLDKERTTVPPKPWFQPTGEWTEPVPTQIIVVSDVEGCTWIWRPAEQKLAANIGSQRVVIDACPR